MQWDITDTVISIHALLAESDFNRIKDLGGTLISIHALLAESDFSGDHGHMSGDISIHALLAESDRGIVRNSPDQRDFYPRSPCGERHQTTTNTSTTEAISIHALLAESDGSHPANVACSNRFLSTLSLRRATCNPVITTPKTKFLSTLSLRRATAALGVALACWIFLSTLSLRRATWLELFLYYQDNNFYPRSPCGERPRRTYQLNEKQAFLSTLSLRRATQSTQSCDLSIRNFYPRSPCGERRGQNPPPRKDTDFYPRSPCGERLVFRAVSSSLVIFLSTLSLRRATAKVHKTVGHFCAYETNFMGIASSC